MIYRKLIKINPEAAEIASRFQFRVETAIQRAFHCEYCGARPWSKCASANGMPASREHVSREWQAKGLVRGCK
jgi:hypothetical protein